MCTRGNICFHLIGDIESAKYWQHAVKTSRMINATRMYTQSYVWYTSVNDIWFVILSGIVLVWHHLHMIFHVTYYISIRLDSLKWMTTASGVLQNSWIPMTDCRNVVTISRHFGVCCVSRLAMPFSWPWSKMSFHFPKLFINCPSTNVIWELFFGFPLCLTGFLSS